MKDIALYIHFPWCVRKCPYCDFNSHEAGRDEAAYLQALLKDLEYEAHMWQGVQIKSIFIGGGTPSLASGQFYQTLLAAVKESFPVTHDLEVTMEANPGALEYDRFDAYLAAGINRLSMGVQSFQDEKLHALGRVHSSQQAAKAYEEARKAGFKRINLDLMFGLPDQSLEDGLYDLQTAIDLNPDHLSWYQLTIEPNTAFYAQPPKLDLEVSHDLWEQGRALISSAGFKQYEVSAYAKPNQECRHNVHYWQFGDYAAIGAGEHGKQTRDDGVWRYHKTRLPAHYLKRLDRVATSATPNGHPFTGQAHVLTPEDREFEYFLNHLRLIKPVQKHDYESKTAGDWSVLLEKMKPLECLGYLTLNENSFQLTDDGFAFLDEVLTRL